MITTRQMTLEVEFVRWILLVVAAVALALALATVAAGAEPMQAPRLLPEDMGDLARPIPLEEPVRPHFPEAPAGDVPPAVMAERLWAVLEEHRAGRTAAAIAGWEQIELRYATAHYRELGLGAAFLQAGDLTEAEMHLTLARQMKPGNPLAAYYMGLLRLEQAAGEGRVRDGRDLRAMWVAYAPVGDKAQFEQMAVDAFRDAIAEVNAIRLDERLLPVDMNVEETLIVPCAGDLMVALGAENFAGRAHLALFGLLLDRAELITAETHLDAAIETGLTTPYAYRDLATAYLATERNADAVRVLNKDLAHNHAWVGRTWHWLDVLAEDAGRQWWVW